MSNHALRRRALPLAVAALTAAMVVPATGSVAATPVTFKVLLDGSCVEGTGPANTAMTIQISKPSGKLADAMTVTSNGAGGFFGCFPKDTPIASGWTLAARKGRKVLRLLVLPRLSVFTDRTTDTVRGKGSVGARLSIAVQDCNTDPSTCTTAGTVKTRVKANGGYRVDVTATLDAIGNDRVTVSRRTGAGDIISRDGSFPFIAAEPEVYRGTANRGQKFSVVLKESPAGSTVATFSEAADRIRGGFSQDADIQLGRELSASFAADAVIVMPTAVLGWDSVEHVISGKCLENRPVLVFWLSTQFYRVRGTADSGGSFSIDLDDDLTPPPSGGTTLYLQCYTPAGDQIHLVHTI